MWEKIKFCKKRSINEGDNNKKWKVRSSNIWNACVEHNSFLWSLFHYITGLSAISIQACRNYSAIDMFLACFVLAWPLNYLMNANSRDYWASLNLKVKVSKLEIFIFF